MRSPWDNLWCRWHTGRPQSGPTGATPLRTAALKQQPVSLVVDQSLRRPLRKLLLREIPDVTVLSYQEVPQEQRVETVSVIRGEEIFASPTGPEVALTAVPRLAA